METEELKKDSELIASMREHLKYAIAPKETTTIIFHCVDNAIAKALYDSWVEKLEQSILHGCSAKSMKDLEESIPQTEPRKLTSKELRKRLKHARNYMEKKALEKKLNETLREEKKRRKAK